MSVGDQQSARRAGIQMRRSIDDKPAATPMATNRHDEEWANGLSHAIGCLLSLIGSAILLNHISVRGSGWQWFSAILYCSSLVAVYAASTLYIAVFMVWLGRYSLLPSALTGVGVGVFFFLMFEKWFAVPLPKGPLERMLGF